MYRERAARESPGRKPRDGIYLTPENPLTYAFAYWWKSSAPKLNGGGKGDLLARLRVTVPKKLTKAEREALEAYQRSSREQPRDHLTRSASA